MQLSQEQQKTYLRKLLANGYKPDEALAALKRALDSDSGPTRTTPMSEEEALLSNATGIRGANEYEKPLVTIPQKLMESLGGSPEGDLSITRQDLNEKLPYILAGLGALVGGAGGAAVGGAAGAAGRAHNRGFYGEQPVPGPGDEGGDIATDVIKEGAKQGLLAKGGQLLAAGASKLLPDIFPTSGGTITGKPPEPGVVSKAADAVLQKGANIAPEDAASAVNNPIRAFHTEGVATPQAASQRLKEIGAAMEPALAKYQQGYVVPKSVIEDAINSVVKSGMKFSAPNSQAQIASFIKDMNGRLAQLPDEIPLDQAWQLRKDLGSAVGERAVDDLRVLRDKAFRRVTQAISSELKGVSPEFGQLAQRYGDLNSLLDNLSGDSGSGTMEQILDASKKPNWLKTFNFVKDKAISPRSAEIMQKLAQSLGLAPESAAAPEVGAARFPQRNAGTQAAPKFTLEDHPTPAVDISAPPVPVADTTFSGRTPTATQPGVPTTMAEADARQLNPENIQQSIQNIRALAARRGAITAREAQIRANQARMGASPPPAEGDLNNLPPFFTGSGSSAHPELLPGGGGGLGGPHTVEGVPQVSGRVTPARELQLGGQNLGGEMSPPPAPPQPAPVPPPPVDDSAYFVVGSGGSPKFVGRGLKKIGPNVFVDSKGNNIVVRPGEGIMRVAAGNPAEIVSTYEAK